MWCFFNHTQQFCSDSQCIKYADYQAFVGWRRTGTLAFDTPAHRFDDLKDWQRVVGEFSGWRRKSWQKDERKADQKWEACQHFNQNRTLQLQAGDGEDSTIYHMTCPEPEAYTDQEKEAEEMKEERNPNLNHKLNSSCGPKSRRGLYICLRCSGEVEGWISPDTIHYQYYEDNLKSGEAFIG